MELATAVAHQLDVTVFIHDDSAFGSIADYQLRHHGRAYATDLVNPDLLAFARSFGVPAERIEDVADLPAAMAPRDRRTRPVGRDPGAARSISRGRDRLVRRGVRR